MNYKFCSNCKASLKEREGLFECILCGMKIFKNSAPTATVIPIKNGKILMSRRAVEPGKGKYDLVGGFLDNGEHPEGGAVREAKEETELDIKPLHLVGVYIGDYEYQGTRFKTLNFYYVAKIIGGKMKPHDDVESLFWIPINKIPTKNLAFEHQIRVFKDFKKWYKTKK